MSRDVNYSQVVAKLPCKLNLFSIVISFGGVSYKSVMESSDRIG